MTTIEDFFGSMGRRRPRAAVPPYPHAQPEVSSETASDGRVRRFVVRVILVLLLLMLVFFARFIPETWNPFSSSGIFASEGAPNGGSGNGPAGALGATSTPAPGAGENGRDGTDGVAGSAGARGADGVNGVNGTSGRDGVNGEKGDTGEAGATGETGATGATGPMGPVGSLGQANSDISACDDNIVVGLRSAWSPDTFDFRVSRVLLSDVSDACAGLYLGFDLLDSNGESLAHVEVSSIALSGSLVTLTATDFPTLALVRSVDVARVAIEIAS